MMIEDRAAKFGKFRFWCDEPHAAFFGSGVEGMGCSFLYGSSSYTSSRSLVLEIMTLKGVRYSYVLLGASYKSSSDVSVSVGDVIQFVTQEIYDDSMIGDFDVVKVGLPSEYVRYIFLD
ncbi:hypothetical protein [Pseudomonas amygdali]|uniref:hypothetical protein n=1 Tax=Pseudomonas amygdali TaxID=47877 RepID=UPI001C5A1116|nr:hypothetical protein [Pseudomonas amygdali]QXW46342.1 hypothetical protein KXJ79_07170 [Pseudomonas amygdali]